MQGKALRIPYKTLLLGPTLLYGLGFVLNALAIAANHGQMPVLWPGGCGDWAKSGDIIHSCMTQATHLKFLCDWVLINGMGVASPGDFMLWQYDLAYLPALYIWIVLVIRDLNATHY